MHLMIWQKADRDYVFTENSPVSRWDFLGLTVPVPSPPEGWDDPAQKVCRDASRDLPGLSPVYGRTLCYKGKAYACLYPEYFEQTPSSAVLACVRKHEEVHIHDPRLECKNGPCDEHILPQMRKISMSDFDKECPAWHATLECLEKLDKTHSGWLQALASAMREMVKCKEKGKWGPPTWSY
jgi:hypothetical protein